MGLIKKNSIALVLILLCTSVFCQSKFVELEGVISSTEETDLNNYNVHLKTRSGNTIALFNTGTTSKYYFKVAWTRPDTLIISVTYAEYAPKIIQIIVNEPTRYINNIILETEHQVLEEVLVESSAIRKSGDTTFYNADAFTEPGQKKLIDLIQTMPGFTVSKSGELLYYNRPIEKFTLAGEEIFANNVQLLLKNVPIHIVKTVQALENQNLNPKLKGLTGDNKVTVNIGLKNNVRELFGDVEAGVGTGDRYLLNPVLFGLYSKLKMGYIGNLNSYGQSIGIEQAAEIKESSYQSASINLIQPGLNVISNFDPSRYITNKLIDNRLQINLPLSKNIQTKTDFVFLKDNQHQSNSGLSSIYSGTAYFKRENEQINQYKPQYLQLSEQIKWDIDKKSLLNAKVSYANDRGAFYENETINQNNDLYTTSNTIRNNVASLIINTSFTRRISLEKAVNIVAEFGTLDIGQDIVGRSPNWQTLFNLPDQSYIYLVQPSISKTVFANISTAYIFKKKGRIHTYYINGEYWNSKRSAPLTFQSGQVGLLPLEMNDFSGGGNYTVKKLSIPFSSSFHFLKQPLIFSLTGGVANISLKENFKSDSWTIPVVNTGLEFKKLIANIANTNIKIGFQNENQSIYEINKTPFPRSVGQFQYTLTPQLTIPRFSANANIFFRFKDFSSLIISQFTYISLFSRVNKLAYIGFVSISADSIVKGNTTSYSNSGLKYSFPFIPLQLKVTVGGNYVSSSHLIFIDNNIGTVKRSSQLYQLELKRKWNKKVYSSYKIDLDISRQRFPSQINNAVTFHKNLSLNQKIGLKVKILDKSEVLFSMEHLHFNLPTAQKQNYLFSDFEFIQLFKHQGVSVRLKIENIFNQKKYQVFNNSDPLNISLYSIPLIQRNIFVSFRVQI